MSEVVAAFTHHPTQEAVPQLVAHVRTLPLKEQVRTMKGLACNHTLSHLLFADSEFCRWARENETNL
jgi:hypothetical protein